MLRPIITAPREMEKTPPAICAPVREDWVELRVAFAFSSSVVALVNLSVRSEILEL